MKEKYKNNFTLGLFLAFAGIFHLAGFIYFFVWAFKNLNIWLLIPFIIVEFIGLIGSGLVWQFSNEYLGVGNNGR